MFDPPTETRSRLVIDLGYSPTVDTDSGWGEGDTQQDVSDTGSAGVSGGVGPLDGMDVVQTVDFSSLPIQVSDMSY